MRKTLLVLLVFITIRSGAQLSEPLRELRSYLKMRSAPAAVDSGAFIDIISRNSLHYLLPFYKGFSQEKQLIQADSNFYYEQMAQAAAFVNDDASAITFEKLSYEKLADSVKKDITALSAAANGVVYTDAKKYILSKAPAFRVVMVDEAHDKPQTHAFIISMLEEMYARGFHILAMDMLYDRGGKAVTKVNASTGYYTNEPVAAELVRRAAEIGFRVVPYEDTVAGHTVNQREYAQAENIYQLIRNDASAKVLVVANNTHIEEGARGEKIPMAAYFKIVSGIDPLTIEQAEMTEGSTNAFGALLYDQWMLRNPPIGPSVALKENQPIDPFGLQLTDVHVIHPPARYNNARPDWTSFGGLRQETQVFPAFRSLFLVQAYYAREYSPSGVNLAVPADQTWLTAQTGVYYLYLRPGKYKLVCRDKAYQVLGTREVEVK